jgi:hypothetical protein
MRVCLQPTQQSSSSLSAAAAQQMVQLAGSPAQVGGCGPPQVEGLGVKLGLCAGPRVLQQRVVDALQVVVQSQNMLGLQPQPGAATWQLACVSAGGGISPNPQHVLLVMAAPRLPG